MTTASTTLSHSAQSAGISPRQTIVEVCRFVATKGAETVALAWLPMVLMSVALFLTFKTYFSLLSVYLAAPSAGMASITMSATIAGFIVCVLVAAIVSARVTRLVQAWRAAADVKLQGLEARVFAAALRFLIIGFVGVAAIASAAFLMAHLLSMRLAIYATWMGWIVAVAFVVIYSVRCGLLIPAVAAFERRSILRRSWALSRARFWRMASVWLAVTILPAVALQILGEFAIGWSSGVVLTTLAQSTERLAGNDVAVGLISLFLTLSTTLSVVLSTAGSCFVYQQLNELP